MNNEIFEIDMQIRNEINIIRYKTGEIQRITDVLSKDTESLVVANIQPLVNEIIYAKNRLMALQETRRSISGDEIKIERI